MYAHGLQGLKAI